MVHLNLGSIKLGGQGKSNRCSGQGQPTSEIGTKRTCRGGLTMSAVEGRADMPLKRALLHRFSQISGTDWLMCKPIDRRVRVSCCTLLMLGLWPMTALRHKRSFHNRPLRETQSAALVPAPEHRLIVFLVNLRLHAIFKPGFDLTRLCETQHLCGSMPEKLGIGSCQDDADYSPAGLARCCLSTSKMPWPRLRSTRKSLSRHRWKTT
jgi:hypothetical protein